MKDIVNLQGNRENKITKYISLIICSYPFLQVYSDKIIIYCTLLSLVLYVCYAHKVTFNLLLIYLCWLVLTSITSLYNDTTSFNRAIGIVCFAIFEVSIICKKNLFLFINIYSRFAWFAVMYMYLQIFLFYIFHIGIMFKLPFFTLNDNLQGAYRYMEIHATDTSIYTRFPGCFSEPSLYASYVIPLLIIKLIQNKKKDSKYILKAIIISVSIIVSTSGLGIVSMFIIWIYYMILYRSNILSVLKKIPVCIISVVMVLSLLFTFFPTFSTATSNLFKISDSKADNSKADYRIYRAIDTYGQLPGFYKLKGIGYGCGIIFREYFQITSKYDSETEYSEFYNGPGQVAIYTGAVGIIFFLGWIVVLFRHSNSKARMMLLGYLLLISASSILLEGMACIYILLIYAFNGRHICFRKKIR